VAKRGASISAWVPVATGLGETFNFAVGAGGAGGIGSAGSPGGTSSFSIPLTGVSLAAAGGTGGLACIAAHGSGPPMQQITSGGVGGGYSLNTTGSARSGEPGQNGTVLSQYPYSPAPGSPDIAMSGSGGGPGGGLGKSTSNSNGNNADGNSGGGGGGANTLATGNDTFGGNGASGHVLVIEFTG